MDRTTWVAHVGETGGGLATALSLLVGALLIGLALWRVGVPAALAERLRGTEDEAEAGE